jgi:outer membrane protein assembly factor BamB
MTPRRIAAVVLLTIVAATATAADGPDELWAAARKGDAATVKRLLTAGVDVNAKTQYGATALSFAADKGHVEVVRELIRAKADVNVKDSFYNATPIVWALVRNRPDIVRELLAAGAEGADGALLTGARTGQADMVRAAIEAGKPKAETLSATLALVPEKAPEVKELLVKAGAKPAAGKDAAAKPAAAATKPAAEANADVKVPAAAPDPDGVITEPKDWPQFRGVGATGVADGQFPPTAWDVPAGRNVRWKTPVPGLGHSCPVVVGDRVYLTTAISGDSKAALRPGQYGDVDSVDDKTEHTWKVLCLDKRTGAVRWERTTAKGVPRVKRHLKGTHANPTAAATADRVVVSFGSEGMFCYSRDGELLWKRDLGTLDSGWFYDAEYQWGFGSSPVIHGDRVFVQCDVGKGSFLAAYDLADGREVWKADRDEIPSWGTPTVIDGPDGPQVVTNATKFARGNDAATGRELWRIGKNAEITVPTPFLGRGLIFVTSGYRPIQPIYAIRPGARGDLTLKDGETKSEFVAWSKAKGGPYLPTPIVGGDYLYTCPNNGVIGCYEAATGKAVYSQRLPGSGGYTASPVAADGRIYFTSEEGWVRVVKAGPKFELLAANPLGDVCMATPAIADGLFLVRTEHYLIALGRPR